MASRVLSGLTATASIPSGAAAPNGKMLSGVAAAVYRRQVQADADIKPR